MDQLRICDLLIDATPFEGQQMVAALGIGKDGRSLCAAPVLDSRGQNTSLRCSPSTPICPARPRGPVPPATRSHESCLPMPVIEEIKLQPLPDGYLHYLRLKLRRLSA